MSDARILIVEDEGLAALSMKTYLEDQGYSVPAVVSSAEEAMELAPQLEPDIVVMDIRLEGEADGIEAGDRLAHGFHIPVIYLTAYSDEDTLVRASRTEPFGYLVKPLDERALSAAIRTALYKSGIERELRRTKEKLETILNCVRDGIVVAGIHGDLDYLNPSARRMLQLQESQPLSGTSVVGLFDLVNAEGARVSLPLQKVLIDGRNASLSGVELHSPSGMRLPIELDLTPLRDERGSPRGVVIAFRDLAERSAAERRD
ncbi:MAG TPA: response regulator [Rectinemataceae bacterium]|nr:response regulator [Rectinemataceae bacterium]